MTKKDLVVAPKNYDYTGKARVQKQRDALAAAGGARVEAMLNAVDLARLDAFVKTGVVPSRRAAVVYLVQQLPEPAEVKPAAAKAKADRSVRKAEK